MNAPPPFALTTAANEIRVAQLRQHNLQLPRIFLKRYVLFDFLLLSFALDELCRFVSTSALVKKQ